MIHAHSLQNHGPKSIIASMPHKNSEHGWEIMSTKSEVTDSSKANNQSQNMRCEQPRIGRPISTLVRNLAGDEYEEELFWGLANSIGQKKNFKLKILGACAAFIAVAGAVYATYNINIKLDKLISIQEGVSAGSDVALTKPVHALLQVAASDEVKKPANDPTEFIRDNIAKTLGLDKGLVLVKAVPEFNLFAVQIGSKGFLTDTTGTVAIPTKVVLPLSGQKEYFSSSTKSDVTSDALSRVNVSSPKVNNSSESNFEPDDQQGLDPNILFSNLGGMTIDLPAKGVKKGEIMVFFDTKCPHCKTQFNDIVAYADKGYEIKFLNTPLKSGADAIFTTAFCSGAPFEALNEYMQNGAFSKSYTDFDAANVGCMRKSGEIVLDVVKLMPVMPGTPYFAIKDVGFGTRKFIDAYLAGN